MKWVLFWGLFWVTTLEGNAQKYVVEKSVVTFFSDAVIEDITATNTKMSSLFNAATGEIVFSIPVRGFQFDKKLMQEHFNEKYLESDKYPKATFSGKLINYKPDDPEVQKVRATGKLTIHGVTREVEIDGTASFSRGIQLKSKFMVALADYDVKIPTIMFQNIAEQVEVSIDITYKIK